MYVCNTRCVSPNQLQSIKSYKPLVKQDKAAMPATKPSTKRRGTPASAAAAVSAAKLRGAGSGSGAGISTQSAARRRAKLLETSARVLEANRVSPRRRHLDSLASRRQAAQAATRAGASGAMHAQRNVTGGHVDGGASAPSGMLVDASAVTDLSVALHTERRRRNMTEERVRVHPAPLANLDYQGAPHIHHLMIHSCETQSSCWH